MAERIVKQIRPRCKVPSLPKEIREKRVAAYARVSSDSDEQMGSVEAQKDYFEKLIREKPGWVLVGVYADEGISGTSLNHREAFARMIDDAMNGKIDLIITKSLSRFARNTVDALNIIRKLKLKDVGVYFEKEDISTLDSKGEFLITLMSSLAEEESRSISENVKWGQRKRFADGRYHMPYKQFLGYKKGANGEPELVEEEAKIIRIIYRLCLEGYSASSIAKQLTDAKIPTPAGLCIWQRHTVKSILQNEKYYGAALLQKTYCVDYRSKEMRKNKGELPMYYVENGHEGVVTKEIFDAVQKRIEAPEENYGMIQRRVLSHSFSGKLFCSDELLLCTVQDALLKTGRSINLNHPVLFCMKLVLQPQIVLFPLFLIAYIPHHAKAATAADKNADEKKQPPKVVFLFFFRFLVFGLFGLLFNYRADLGGLFVAFAERVLIGDYDFTLSFSEQIVADPQVPGSAFVFARSNLTDKDTAAAVKPFDSKVDFAVIKRAFASVHQIERDALRFALIGFHTELRTVKIKLRYLSDVNIQCVRCRKRSAAFVLIFRRNRQSVRADSGGV